MLESLKKCPGFYDAYKIFCFLLFPPPPLRPCTPCRCFGTGLKKMPLSHFSFKLFSLFFFFISSQKKSGFSLPGLLEPRSLSALHFYCILLGGREENLWPKGAPMLALCADPAVAFPCGRHWAASAPVPCVGTRGRSIRGRAGRALKPFCGLEGLKFSS